MWGCPSRVKLGDRVQDLIPLRLMTETYELVAPNKNFFLGGKKLFLIQFFYHLIVTKYYVAFIIKKNIKE